MELAKQDRAPCCDSDRSCPLQHQLEMQQKDIEMERREMAMQRREREVQLQLSCKQNSSICRQQSQQSLKRYLRRRQSLWEQRLPAFWLHVVRCGRKAERLRRYRCKQSLVCKVRRKDTQKHRVSAPDSLSRGRVA